jgi:hypothetical protein
MVNINDICTSIADTHQRPLTETGKYLSIRGMVTIFISASIGYDEPSFFS